MKKKFFPLNIVFPCLGMIGCVSHVDTKPNVLVILVDDAGYSSFSFNGGKDIQTRNIDQLSNEGVICTDAHVMGSVSAPSRAMLMTGRYGQRFGFECNLDAVGAGVPGEEITLGDYFKEAGYATAAIGKWHLGDSKGMTPNEQGFEHFFGFLDGSRSYYYRPDRDDRKGDLHCMQLNGKPYPFDGYLTDVLTDNAISYINSVGDKPFMMYLAYNAIHTPLEAPEGDLKKFEGHPRQKILAMTEALDRNVGRLIDNLKKNGKFDNTLIFFLADNGGAINNLESNLPLKGFKGNKFEGGHRIPFFVVYGDKLKNKGNYKGLVSSFDIMATSLSLCGIKPSQEKVIDGVDILPYLTGEKVGSAHDYLFWRKMRAKAVRTPKYKYIEQGGFGSVLYDMNSDLYETTDVKEKYPEVCKDLAKKLEEWESDKIERKWDDGGSWPEVSDTIHMDLMKNVPLEDLILYPGQKRKSHKK